MTAAAQAEEEWTAWIPPRPQRRALPRQNWRIFSALQRDQVKVSPRYTGDAITTTAELNRKLGKTAYRVWAALLTIRDGEAEAHPSMRGLARKAGTTLHQTRRSLIRLREAKLVVDYGFQWKTVPCACQHGCWGHKVFVRTVAGTIWPDGAGADRVRVPRETNQWLKAASTHGGARAGAGRPAGAKDSFQRTRRPSKQGGLEQGRYNQDALPISTQKEKYSERATLSLPISRFSHSVKESESEGVKEALESLPPPSPALAAFLSSVPGEGLPSFPVASKRARLTRARPADPVLAAVYAAAGVRMHDAAPAQPATPAPQAALAPLKAELAPIDFGVVRDADGTITIRLGDDDGRPAARQRYTAEDLAAMPTPHDVEQEIRPASIPPPPRLPDNASPDALVAACMLAMRAGHERVLGRAYWRPPSRRQLSKAEAAAVLAGAQALLEQKLAPLPWVLFSLRHWHGEMGKTDPAPLKWVFDPKRIEKHHGWCRQAIGSLNTGAIIRTPAYQEVVKRNQQLRNLLGWGKPTADVVREVYPPGVKARLWAQAREEADRARKLIQDQLQGGEWLWGNM